MTDAPIYERAYSDGTHTARLSIDVSDGVPFAVLAIEPDEGELRQMLVRLDRAGLVALRMTEAVRVWDRQVYAQNVALFATNAEGAA